LHALIKAPNTTVARQPHINAKENKKPPLSCLTKQNMNAKENNDNLIPLPIRNRNEKREKEKKNQSPDLPPVPRSGIKENPN